jgi:hypothetical protein
MSTATDPSDETNHEKFARLREFQQRQALVRALDALEDAAVHNYERHDLARLFESMVIHDDIHLARLGTARRSFRDLSNAALDALDLLDARIKSQP